MTMKTRHGTTNARKGILFQYLIEFSYFISIVLKFSMIKLGYYFFINSKTRRQIFTSSFYTEHVVAFILKYLNCIQTPKFGNIHSSINVTNILIY